MPQAGREPADRLQVRRVVVVARHEGHAKPDDRSRLVERSQIAQDRGEWHTRVLTVSIRIEHLQVVEKEVGDLCDLPQNCKRRETARVDCGPEAATLCIREAGDEEAGLEERLSPENVTPPPDSS